MINYIVIYNISIWWLLQKAAGENAKASDSRQVTKAIFSSTVWIRSTGCTQCRIPTSAAPKTVPWWNSNPTVPNIPISDCRKDVLSRRSVQRITVYIPKFMFSIFFFFTWFGSDLWLISDKYDTRRLSLSVKKKKIVFQK